MNLTPEQVKKLEELGFKRYGFVGWWFKRYNGIALRISYGKGYVIRGFADIPERLLTDLAALKGVGL